MTNSALWMLLVISPRHPVLRQLVKRPSTIGKDQPLPDWSGLLAWRLPGRFWVLTRPARSWFRDRALSYRLRSSISLFRSLEDVIFSPFITREVLRYDLQGTASRFR
jgi:hypothetical protein